MPPKRLLKGEKDNIQPIKEVAHSTKKRTAIFYGRVSSGTQAKEDSGGLDRQKFASLEWEKKNHHDCEIDWDKAGSLQSQGLKLVDFNSLLIWSKMVRLIEIQFLLQRIFIV